MIDSISVESMIRDSWRSFNMSVTQMDLGRRGCATYESSGMTFAFNQFLIKAANRTWRTQNTKEE